MGKKWTIGVTYDARDTSTDKPMRARSAVHVVAECIATAYQAAEKSAPPGSKLGAIIPGHHSAGGVL
jgi:hypothetical protein